ncbi:hypothetical protein TRIP_C20403 [Candidatus Zixiibacteriota bacterium]|nr:hypothetical protein TRIP_C20403 [candidate division Zixibacteria bacterium]
MQRITILFILIFLILGNSSLAQSFLPIFNDTLFFERPDTAFWQLTINDYDDDAGKGIVMFVRNAIIDSSGMSVLPVIGIVYEKLPSDSEDVIYYSLKCRYQSSFAREIDSVLSWQDGFVTYRNAVGYLASYTSKGVKHKILLVHMIHGDIGIQIICDSTESVYEKVEKDMRRFLKSVTMQ